MDFGALLDAAISVLAIVLLFSLAASAINEAIADFLNLRGRTLRRAVAKLLARTARETGADDGTRPARLDDAAFFEHPDIRALGRDRLLLKGGREPSAIEPRRYALTVLKLLEEREAIESRASHDFATLRREVVDQVADGFGHESDAATRVDAIFDKIGGQAATARAAVERRSGELEREFTEMMDRASGWYLRRTRAILFAIGLVLAVGANIDILHHADRVMRLENTRAQTDALAAMLGADLPDRVGAVLGRDPADGSPDPDDRVEATIRELADALGAMQVRVGWECRPVAETAAGQPLTATLEGRFGCEDGHGIGPITPGKSIGWLIVAFGVTLGAQFWFDAFRWLVHLRTSGLVGGAAEAEAERRT